jgi:2-hydroxy-3-oxopropionate reductase
VRIAFIGLGVMGLPMSLNLLRAGHEVVGFTRTASRGEPLVAAGGTLAGSLAEAVTGADAVITMLPDSPDVQAVYTGDGGVLGAVGEGTLLIDASTIQPGVASDIAAQAAAQGLTMIDAPVSGGEKGAQDAALSIMVGGTPEGFAAAKPLLEAVGTTIVHVGPAGSGQTVKAANQLLVAGIIELVSEALVFLDAHGVELEPAVEVLNGGLAGNTVLTRKGAAMLAGNFAPGFRVELHHKDLGIYREAARSHDVFSPLGAVVGELMNSLRQTGGAQLDHGALLTQVDKLSGRDHWSAS